ncbi:MAG: fused MFS/spermidine synthase [Candidatus Altiarchaeota archaeon]
MELKLADNRFFLLFVAFVSGASIMCLELAASRVLAPSFGSSIYVWGALIGVIMAALSLGYFLGGWVADREGGITALFKCMAYSGVLISLIPAVSKPVLAYTMRWGLVFGPVAASFILFALPMILLSMVSPMVVKAYAGKISTVGGSAGLVFAVATVGSMVGTFSAAFVMLPALGVRAVLLADAVVVFLIGFAGLGRREYLLLVLFLVPGVASAHAQCVDLKGFELLYCGESEYNVIGVYDSPWYRVLTLNDGSLVQTVERKGSPLTGMYYDVYSLGPLLTSGKRVLFFGLAGGTAVKQLIMFHEVNVDAVEIDGKVVDVARDYFNVTEGDGLRIFVADGRRYLSESGEYQRPAAKAAGLIRRKLPNQVESLRLPPEEDSFRAYDMVGVDVFNGPNLPVHMSTVEFFSEVSDHLGDDGVVMVNVVSSKGDRSVGDAVAYTMKQVFPSVYTVDLEYNRIIVAFKKETSESEVIRRLKANSNPLLKGVVEGAVLNLREFNAVSGVVLTDDRSNIEELTFKAFASQWHQL